MHNEPTKRLLSVPLYFINRIQLEYDFIEPHMLKLQMAVATCVRLY